MKSLLKENLIININTKIIIKKKSLSNSKFYFGEYAQKKNTLIMQVDVEVTLIIQVILLLKADCLIQLKKIQVNMIKKPKYFGQVVQDF